MAEFSIIEKYCRGIGVEHKSTKLNIGDDAAIVEIPNDMELAISVDTMVEGVHFYPDTDPAFIAHKLAAVNLSDMAAMGAKPKWATLTLTLPKQDEAWLAAFSTSLDAIAKQHGLQLVGGDTSQGPLNLSLQIMGLLPKGKALTRNNARVGNDVYVSNTLGDAALALQCIEGSIKYRGQNLEVLRNSLERPEPQVQLGLGLLNIARSCIDLSDGVVADLSHLAKLSEVSIELDVDRLPLSPEYQRYINCGGNIDLALSGGDDYQLAFTASPARRGELIELSKSIAVPITKIGSVVDAQNDVIVLMQSGQTYELQKKSGYEHFDE